MALRRAGEAPRQVRWVGCAAWRPWRRLAAAALCCASTAVAAAGADAPCRGIAYLTFDTGTMRHAESIAAMLARQRVLATFFLANETTVRGDQALDAGWAPYWKARAAEGHAFGTHTWRHGRFAFDQPGGQVRYRPQFGTDAGRWLTLTPAGVCKELRRVEAPFREATGRGLDALWRAPGGHVTPHALAAARACGYAHVHWAPAGFLGDELPSDTHPNDLLLKRALRDLRDGDVIMAHLGIRSRQDPFAPMIEPLIQGLRSRGFCFRTLIEHPAYRNGGNSTARPDSLPVTAAATMSRTASVR